MDELNKSKLIMRLIILIVEWNKKEYKQVKYLLIDQSYMPKIGYRYIYIWELADMDEKREEMFLLTLFRTWPLIAIWRCGELSYQLCWYIECV